MMNLKIVEMLGEVFPPWRSQWGLTGSGITRYPQLSITCGVRGRVCAFLRAFQKVVP